MVGDQTFVPRWASPPGATIRGVLDERGIAVETFAREIDVPVARVERLLRGDEPISIDLARRLARYLGASVEFWMTRDGQYRDDLSRLAADDWVQTLPIADMTALGWVDKARTWHEQIGACLDFFGVRDFESWRIRYEGDAPNARYRLSEASPINQHALAAWLRRAEIEAEAIGGDPWDRDQFRLVLNQIRPLTRRSKPEHFLPQLQELCASAGVVVTVLRAPRGCLVSGAARLLAPDQAQIVLSGRYLADDHLWFTFFHECAHLLNDNPSEVYVDELDRQHSDVDSEEEKAADRFAADFLVPPDVRADFPQRRPSPLQVHALARRAGVSEGVVVGQMQHAGVLGYATRLNELKRRFTWHGASLEKA